MGGEVQGGKSHQRCFILPSERCGGQGNLVETGVPQKSRGNWILRPQNRSMFPTLSRIVSLIRRNGLGDHNGSSTVF